jgi:hypothetical protein
VKGILYDHCPTALKTENIHINLNLTLTLTLTLALLILSPFPPCQFSPASSFPHFSPLPHSHPHPVLTSGLSSPLTHSKKDKGFRFVRVISIHVPTSKPVGRGEGGLRARVRMRVRVRVLHYFIRTILPSIPFETSQQQ